MNNYFSHDSNARNSEKMIKVRMKYGAEGYGVYFMILERLRDEANYMSIKDYNVIAFDLRVDASIIKAVVEDFGLFVFTDDGKYFYSDGFNKRMALKDSKAKKLAEAGKRGAKKRWQQDSHPIATPSKNNSHPNGVLMASDSKESKVKESKVNKSKPKKTTEEPVPSPREKVLAFYQQNLGQPAPVVIQELDDWLEDHSPEWVIAALTIAAESHRQFPTARTVMRRWQKENIKTLDDIKADQVSWENRKTRGSQRKPPISVAPNSSFSDDDIPF